MMRLNRFAAAAVLAFLVTSPMGGCTTFAIGEKIAQVSDVVSGAKIDPAAIVVISNSFDAVQDTASNYLELRSCRRTVSKVCRDPKATKPLVAAITAGRRARNAAQQFLLDHPDELGPRGLYDAVAASVTTIRSILTNYGVQS